MRGFAQETQGCAQKIRGFAQGVKGYAQGSAVSGNASRMFHGGPNSDQTPVGLHVAVALPTQQTRNYSF